MDDTDEELCILLLGEGNFSFTSSLVEKLQPLHKTKIVATSYDSLEELYSKYPDSIRSILKKLSNHEQVHVMHGIDASVCLKDQLLDVDGSFDHIIFNFPHLGTEDCVLHMSMIGHIMHSVKSVLKNQNAMFHLSLSQQQYERWNVEKMSSLNNYVLHQQIPLQLSNWPLYEMKRHHTGKSFKNRIDECFTWSFTCSALMNTATNYQGMNIFTLPNPTTLPIAESTTSNTKDKKRKRKMYLLTEGKYTVETTGDKCTYKCSICEKVFLLEQGIRSHIHSMHGDSTSSSASEAVKHMCVECNRSFTDEEAYNQHRLAKHDGKYEVVKPAWAAVNKVNTSEPDIDPSKTFTCSICNVSFESSEVLATHLKGFQPFGVDKLGEELECNNCKKKLYSKRALYQHANVCASKIVAEQAESCVDCDVIK